MTWFTHLESVIKARTVHENGWGNLPGSAYVNTDTVFIAQADTSETAAFIALSGTIADEVLDVLRAALALYSVVGDGDNGLTPRFNGSWYELDEALTALAKKVEAAE